MGNYLIIIDTATQPNENTKYGESSAAWIIYIGNTVINAGIQYFIHHGPNKVVYEGILGALNQLEHEHFHSSGTDNVKIVCDCKVVIDQINHKCVSEKMKSYQRSIESFCLRHKNVKFSFCYESDREQYYKIVHMLSKDGKSWLKNWLKKNNKSLK